jgi:hypothetical protein
MQLIDFVADVRQFVEPHDDLLKRLGDCFVAVTAELGTAACE